MLKLPELFPLTRYCGNKFHRVMASSGADLPRVARSGSRHSMSDGGDTIVDPDSPMALAEQWEDCRRIRTRLRENDNKLVKWVNPELVNKPSMAAIALNCKALTILAAWWCPKQSKPKSPSVLDLKKEAFRLKSKRLYGCKGNVANIFFCYLSGAKVGITYPPARFGICERCAACPTMQFTFTKMHGG